MGVLFGIQLSILNFPDHMPNFAAVVIACDFSLPVAEHHFQRIVELDKKGSSLICTGFYQFLFELLGSGNFRCQYNQLIGSLGPELDQIAVVILIQPLLQSFKLIYHFLYHSFRIICSPPRQ